MTKNIFNLSGTQLRQSLINNEPIPEFFSYPEVIKELRKAYQKVKGICISFTGLPSSEKSTLAQALQVKFLGMDEYRREVTILDGDIMRQYLSSELGFSRKDRSINTQRIGFVASLIVRHGGICFTVNIAPYAEDRKVIQDLISQEGFYFEVYVNTPLHICEIRDPKGFYKAVKEGKIPYFIGVSDPYEIPIDPDLELNGILPINQNVNLLLDLLKKHL
ncbi:MAG: adenylyl-sulfate kinase [Candidatus Rhabdochlamydia sp.]